MIGEPPQPKLAFPTDDSAEFMRISAFDQLHSPLDGDIKRGRQQKMHMLRHQNKSMQFVSSLAAVPIKSSQEDPNIRFNHEQSAPFPSNKCDEISSRRRDEPRRPQCKPQRLKAASVSELKLARVELAPFPVIFHSGVFILGNGLGFSNPASLRRRHRQRRTGRCDAIPMGSPQALIRAKQIPRRRAKLGDSE